MAAKKDKAATSAGPAAAPTVVASAPESAPVETPVSDVLPATGAEAEGLPEVAPAPHVETEVREAAAVDGPRGEGIPLPADGVERETELPGRGPHCGFCTVERPCLKEWVRAGYPVEAYADQFGAASFAEAQSWDSFDTALQGGTTAALTIPTPPPAPPGYFWRRVRECVGASGFAPDLGVRRNWDEGHIGAFHQHTIDSAPHCFEEL